MDDFPLDFYSELYIPNNAVIDEVKVFLKTFGVEPMPSPFRLQNFCYPFLIPAVIDDVKIYTFFDDSRSFMSNNRSLICFYDYHKFSEADILDACESLAQQHKNHKFDDTLILLVAIRDGAHKKEISLEFKRHNVRFVEWCVNSSEEDTRKILHFFVRMVVIKTYFDTIRCLHKNSWFITEEDRQLFSEGVSTKVLTWSLDSGSLFSITVLRYLDLLRIGISYIACAEVFKGFRGDSDFAVGETALLWKCPSKSSHLQWKTDTSFKMTHHFELHHSYTMPVSSANHPVSIFFQGKTSILITLSLKSQESEIFGRSLVIKQCLGTLNLSDLLLQFISLSHLVISTTSADVKNLAFPVQFRETMRHLVLVRCELTEIPQDVGNLIRLTVLNISENPIRILPVCLGNLRELRIFLHEECPIKFPPKNVLKKSAREVVIYLRAHDGESVPHNQAKLIVAGQERVGKSTLIKAMKRNIWRTDVKPPGQTFGVEIETLEIEGTQFLVYDLAGDVEYHNTHPLFLSSECLHLVVFDISHIVVDKGNRSVDQLCRLELWLQMIAAQHLKSYVIIVGTHADDSKITTEILANVRKKIVKLMEKYRNRHREYFANCMLCDEKSLTQELREAKEEAILDDVTAAESCIPHVLGYFEVSSIKKYPPDKLSLTNKNIKSLKSAILSSNRLINEAEFGIPKTWRSFYVEVSQREMKKMVDFSEFCSLASEVPSEFLESMLRFFHSQGIFLWYEDIPELRDVIITDPKWLSNHLRNLISQKPICVVPDGILSTPSLSEVWPEMTEENRQQLLALFRSVGLCFSISDKKELFPCNLPIGWPDKRKWHSLPKEDESQTSLLFNFTFLPPTFFPKLIVEVNKKRASFPANADPLYYRFHIYYDTMKNDKCDIHSNESNEDVKSNTNHHKVHYEIIPHKNSMKVSIRGPSPCCIVSDVCSTIKGVQSSSYPGVAFQTHLICPLCEMEKENDPGLFSLTSTEDGNLFCLTCREYLGSIDDTKRGKYKVPQNKTIRKDDFGKILEDYHCPKLFVVLPINIKCSSLKDRFVYSSLKDGYAVHLLCECPDQWHFVNSPGFRIAKPKEFLEKYGKHLCTVMKAIGKLDTPLRAAAVAGPLCKAGAAFASGASSIAKELEGFLFNAFEKYPQLNPASYRDLGDLKKPLGLQRSELAKFLETVVHGREFGPLVFTYVEKSGEWLWLCEEHNREFTVVNK